MHVSTMHCFKLQHQLSNTLSLFHMIKFSVRQHSYSDPFPEELLHRYYKEYSTFDVPDAVNGFVSFSKAPLPHSHTAQCLKFLTEYNIGNLIIFTTGVYNNFITKG